ncbi:MAG: DUF2085 domain-containing protein [Candidatus Poseidonia sp.]|jgi:uncharacterized membrane protein|nr:DUF2085 domain-containing protein [Poseidonia sp.]
MEPNGLEHRQAEAKVGRWVMGVCGFLLIAFFLAPMSIEPGTVQHLGARANAMDYVSEDGWGSSGSTPVAPHRHAGEDNHTHDDVAWSNLNPFAAFIYGFGDLNCHQKHERSWEVNNNQLPVCTRDVGIFMGLFMGGALFSRRGWNRWTVRDTCLSLFPDAWMDSTYQTNRRTLVWLGVGTLLCLPLIADGFLQLLTSYESTNLKRVLTGVPFGFGLGILTCAMFSARAGAFVGAGQVLLPGNATFVLAKSSQEAHEEE